MTPLNHHRVPTHRQPRPLFSVDHGDVVLLVTHDEAIDIARDRAEWRGCRQTISLERRLTDSIKCAIKDRHSPRIGFWVVQDVR